MFLNLPDPRGALWAGRTRPLFWATRQVSLREMVRCTGSFRVCACERTLSKCYLDTSFHFYRSERLTHGLTTRLCLSIQSNSINTEHLIPLYLTQLTLNKQRSHSGIILALQTINQMFNNHKRSCTPSKHVALVQCPPALGRAEGTLPSNGTSSERRGATDGRRSSGPAVPR